MRLAFNILRGNAIRGLFTLYGSSLNVNTNAGVDTRGFGERRREKVREREGDEELESRPPLTFLHVI